MIRERILDLFELTCGARLLYNYMWVGGVSHDLPTGFVEASYRFLDEFEKNIKEYHNILSYNKIFIERTADVGVMPKRCCDRLWCNGTKLDEVQV